MVFELDEIKRVNRKNQVLMTARNADLIEVNTQIKELNRHLISAQEKQRQQLSRHDLMIKATHAGIAHAPPIAKNGAMYMAKE